MDEITRKYRQKIWEMKTLASDQIRPKPKKYPDKYGDVTIWKPTPQFNQWREKRK